MKDWECGDASVLTAQKWPKDVPGGDGGSVFRRRAALNLHTIPPDSRFTGAAGRTSYQT